MARRSRLEWFAIGNRIRTTSFRTLSAPHRRRLRFEPLEDRQLLSITVNTLVDENDGVGVGDISLRDAIAAAMPGETISFSVSGTIALVHGSLLIDKDLTINGPGAAKLTIDGQLDSRVFNVDDGNAGTFINPTIRGMTIARGLDGGGGGGILSSENLNLFDSVVSGNLAVWGAGIYLKPGAELSLHGSTVSGNVASTAGGGLYNYGATATIEHSVISGNIAPHGAGILNVSAFGDGAVLDITDSQITGNTASDSGGGIRSVASNISITTSIVSGNTAGGFGGGLDIYGGTASIVESRISGSSAGVGGGIALRYGGYATIDRTTVDGNAASVYSSSYGGGIYVNSSTLTANNSTISGNQASWGGGFYVVGPLEETSVTVHNSTISGNLANAVGGGIYLTGGHLNVKFSTITDNWGGAQGDGISVFADDERTVAVFRSSIVIGNFDNDVQLVNGSDNTIISNDYNAVEIVSAGTFAQPNDLIVTRADVALGPLADNGGPTKTHALRLDSVAIDAGDVSLLPAFDQRGEPFARVFDGDDDTVARADIGAFEVDSAYLIVDTLDDENDGSGVGFGTSLRDALAEAGLITSIPVVIQFDPALTELGPATIELLHGQLEVTSSVTIVGPGAELLTIDAQQNSRVFNVSDGLGSHSFVTISGLAIMGGRELGSIGGGIYNAEQLTVADSAVTGNMAIYGGGIYSDVEAVLNVERSVVSGNTASDSGGGVYNWGGSVAIRESTVTGNMADSGGGVVNANFGDASIVASTIHGNHALDGRGGGVIQAGYSMTILNSTISGNSASDIGGGIEQNFGPLEIYHSTITANRADSDEVGGGTGGGIFHPQGPSITIDHTIVAGNFRGASTPDDIFSTAPPEIYDVYTRYSLIGVNTDAHLDDIDGNIIGTGASPIDPLLSPLADNGGPTMTHALLAGSPAIDAGDPNAEAGIDGVPDFDQRGEPFERIRDGNAQEDIAPDIGAYEVQQFVLLPALLGDYNLDEVVDAADYTVWRNTLDEFVGLAYSGADGNGNQMIDEGDYDVWKQHYGESLPQPPGAGGLAAAISSSESAAVSTTQQPPAPPAVRASFPFDFPASSNAKPPTEPGAVGRISVVGTPRFDALITWIAESRQIDSDSDLTDVASHGESDADAETSALGIDAAFASFGEDELHALGPGP